MNEPPLLTQPQSRCIGQCIYCKSTKNLSREHIVPYGLLGIWTLRKASCQQCRDITSAFETSVLRDYFIQVRTSLKLPTRRPQERPKSFDYTVSKNGKEQVVNIPASEITTIFTMPIFNQPGCMTNNQQVNGFAVRGMSLHGSTSSLEKLKAKYDMDSINYTSTLDNSFLRLLAKIAYGMVVLKYGLDAIQEAFVLPSILGTKDDVSVWVGCKNPDKSPALLRRVKGIFHGVQLEINDKKVIAANIRLFESFQTPEYLVVVGRLK